MTLREKLSQIHPECVNPAFGGGAIGCPFRYPELNSAGDCDGRGYNMWKCASCWNQEYKEPARKPGWTGFDSQRCKTP